MLEEKIGSIKKVKTGLVMNQISQDTKLETDTLRRILQCHWKTGGKFQEMDISSIKKVKSGLEKSQTSQAILLDLHLNMVNIQLMLNKIDSLENMRTQKETIGLLTSQNWRLVESTTGLKDQNPMKQGRTYTMASTMAKTVRNTSGIKREMESILRSEVSTPTAWAKNFINILQSQPAILINMQMENARKNFLSNGLILHTLTVQTALCIGTSTSQPQR